MRYCSFVSVVNVYLLIFCYMRLLKKGVIYNNVFIMKFYVFSGINIIVLV